MDTDYEKTVRYINTDLLLVAPFDLLALSKIIAPEHVPDPPIICLHVGHLDNIGHRAHFEAFGHDGNYGTPEESIQVLLDAIEQLPETVQPLWRACTKKTLDIGYNSGITPRHVINPLSLHTLSRMQALGIDMSITVYQMA